MCMQIAINRLQLNAVLLARWTNSELHALFSSYALAIITCFKGFLADHEAENPS